MCGIAGILTWGPDPASPAKLLNRMCDIMRHRGPDDSGIFNDSKAALGHTRLSIVDLQGGTPRRSRNLYQESSVTSETNA